MSVPIDAELAMKVTLAIVPPDFCAVALIVTVASTPKVELFAGLVTLTVIVAGVGVGVGVATGLGEGDGLGDGCGAASTFKN